MNGYTELKKILAEKLGVPESEITEEDIKKFLEDFKTEYYLKKFKQST